VGIEVFFADVTERWAGHVDLITRLTGLAEDMLWTARAKARLRRATGVEPVTSPQERVAAPSQTLADDARVRAFEVLGDRPGRWTSWSASYRSSGQRGARAALGCPS